MAAATAIASKTVPTLYMDDFSSSNSTSSSNSLSGKSSNRRCAFTRKCARLVKEHRARFYIMRRCISMLICWREYDS